MGALKNRDPGRDPRHLCNDPGDALASDEQAQFSRRHREHDALAEALRAAGVPEVVREATESGSAPTHFQRPARPDYIRSNFS